MSWCTAYRLVRQKVRAGARLDAWVSSRDEIAALLFVQDARKFADVLNVAADSLGNSILDDEGHTAYTLRYAHLYYRDDHDGVGGLTFPGNAAPTYFDFAYFAFTIGMCFQTADVSITSRRFRRAVMAHAVLSFAYNTTILATAVSLIVGFLG